MSNITHVAVAILYFGEQYLLGLRNTYQHQGGKYEFIGGKIETFKNGISETPRQGLIREVFEEIGCDISQNIAIKMGIIRHTYVEKDKPEKSVALHCFKIELNQNQFQQLQGETGTEGQAIMWVTKADLLAKKYPLPEANARILAWLKMPDVIVISQPLASFDSEQDWVKYYAKKLPRNSYFYVRPQCGETQYLSLLEEFLAVRKDVMILARYAFITAICANKNFESADFIFQLSHQEIVHLDLAGLPKSEKYVVSCHDSHSVKSCGELAETHTVMGCFLSPVLSTPTHPENKELGWEKFSELAEMSNVPVYGLGGLGQKDLGKVWENNGFGVAGIRLIEGFLQIPITFS